jgi:hypothetical protein
MNEVELTVSFDKQEITLWRLANSKSASKKDWETAAIVLLTSLRRRGCRYQVRKLGYNAAI